jgi:iron complex outermembrane receptor protein
MDRLDEVVELAAAWRRRSRIGVCFMRRSLIGLMLMVGWASAAAQTLPALLRGVVYDPSGLPVEHAVVRVLSPDGTVVSQTMSGPDGRWTLQTDLASPRVLAIDVTGFAGVRRPIDAASLAADIVVTLAIPPYSEQAVVTSVGERSPLTIVTDARQPRQPIPAQDGADYLDTIPGFSTVRKGGSGADPVLRGMAGSRLSILTDGGSILGGCSVRMDPPTSYVFPEAYDIITVIKGPQTVKYGAAAPAGTVLFARTNERLAAPSWQANASLIGGAWKRNDQVFDLRAGTPVFYVRAAAGRSASGNYRDGEGQAVHSEYARWNAETAFGWTPDATTRLEVASSLGDGRAAYADRGVDGSRFRRIGTGISFEKRRPGALVSRLEAAASYNYTDHVMDNYTLRTFQPSMMSPSPSAMNPDRTTYGGRVLAALARNDVTVETGIDLHTNTHTTRSSMRQDTVPVETLPRVSDARFTNVGVFGELDYRARARTRLVGGLRIDRATGTDLRSSVALSMMETVPNPTVGQRRTDALASGFARVEQGVSTWPVTLYAGLGRVRRFPDYWELVTKESQTSLSAFGTRPETTTQLDAGAQVRRGATSAYLSTYAGVVDDYILIESNYAKRGMMGTRLTTVTRNVSARTAGAEMGLTHRVGTRWTVDGSLAYAHGTNRTDRRPLAQMPPIEARLGAQYADPRWSFGGLVRLVGAQRRVALNQGTIVGQDFRETEGFRVTSVNAGWRRNAVLSVTAGVDNLFNETYAEHVSRQGAAIPGFALQTTQVREPGRTVWVRLNLRH